MKIGCIGYRFIDPKDQDYYSGKTFILFNELDDLVNDYPDPILYCGLNPGIENIFAWVAITDGLPLVGIIPYVSFDLGWHEEDQKYYKEIQQYEKFSLQVTTKGGFKEHKDHQRNRILVDQIDVLIAVGEDPRVIKIVEYAKFMGRETITISTNSLITKENEKRTQEIL